MAELRDVTPQVPVRLRPVTPKRMHPSTRRELERQSTGLLPRLVRVRAPGDAPQNNPLVAEQADAPVSEAGARRACPFDSDRGDQFSEVR